MKRIFGSTDLTPSINSKNLSQAINLTAGATAAVATPTSIVYKNTINSFMFGVFLLSPLGLQLLFLDHVCQEEQDTS